jgi:hypothetical protein
MVAVRFAQGPVSGGRVCETAEIRIYFDQRSTSRDVACEPHSEIPASSTVRLVGVVVCVF